MVGVSLFSFFRFNNKRNQPVRVYIAKNKDSSSENCVKYTFQQKININF